MRAAAGKTWTKYSPISKAALFVVLSVLTTAAVVATYGSPQFAGTPPPAGSGLTTACVNCVVATVTVGNGPIGVAYDSTQGEVFVANNGASTVSVISTSTNAVVATVTVGSGPYAVAYDSTQGEVFVANLNAGTVSVISTSTNAVVATVTVGSSPAGVAYDPTDGEVFVANNGAGTVSVVSVSSGQVPPAPTGLSMSSVTSSSATAQWIQSTGGGIVNDTVSRFLGGSCTGTAVLLSTGGAATSLTFTGLAAGTQYSVEVASWNATGESPESACVSFVTASPTVSQPGTAYMVLESGTPTEAEWSDGAVFTVREFVLTEPSGSVPTSEVTRQVWEDLVITLIGGPGTSDNWNVRTSGVGYFDLLLNLTSAQIIAVEGGSGLIELNSTVRVGNLTLPASGQITGPTLVAATPPTGWWSTWFGMPNPPPNADSVEGAFAFLAWLDQSVTGRALYMVVTLVAVTVYVYEAHKLARSKITGQPTRRGAGS